jgi:hypothetical protein
VGVREFTEQELGVHHPQQQAEACLIERRQLAAELDEKRREYAKVKQQIDEREMEVINDVSAENHGSATARKEAVKEAIATDRVLIGLRVGLDEAKDDIDSVEEDLKTVDLTIKAAIARMEELGGLLHLYAATKQAGSQTA